MRITLAYSGGTYRGVQLARELEARGYLGTLFIPQFFDDNARTIDPQRVKTSFGVALVQFAMHRTAKLRRAKPTQRHMILQVIDQWVARNIGSGADVCIAESNMALYTLRRAKELGMVTVLDRTGTHIAYQSKVWEEESAKSGVTWERNSQRVVEKGMKEYEEADLILTLSSFAKDTFIERGVSREKVVCVSPGIDVGPFNQVKKSDEVFRVIYCGAILQTKGVQYLLDAYRSLSLKNAELWLIGHVYDDMRSTLRRYESHCKVFGVVPNTELYRLFSQGSVFVFPSLEDGFGKVLLEAMACGLPAISTTNTGANDVIREGVDGYIIPIRDVEALKEKMLFAYENAELMKEMGRNAKARIHAGFTIEHYFNRMLTTLTKCTDLA